MRSVIGGMLLGLATWAGAPTSLLAHGGHAGGHEGPFGIFHPVMESGSVSVTVALVGLVAGAALVVARLRSKA